MKKILGSCLLVSLIGLCWNFDVTNVVATCGFTTATANQIVKVINAYGTATFAISLVLALTGAGASISSLVGAIYVYIRKQGTKHAVYW